ncbi:lipid A 4'-phosphatase [Nitratiruptor sp. YY08-10]|nr:lipid A 4'-phosphatase [Nitratiruptor sp. YY08-10]
MLHIIYKATMILITLFTLAIFMLFVIELLFKKEWISKKILVYLLLVLLIGPGLIVNVVFKNHFGRARPSQIEQFGGTKKFTPALQIADQCKKNCSFSSGHAAAAFYFLALIPLFRGRKRKIIAALAIIWGSVVGLVRIAQGGHFLSDVYCSAVVVYFVSIIVYYLLFERKQHETFGGHTGYE